MFWSIEISCLKPIFLVLQYLLPSIIFVQLNFSCSLGIIHEGSIVPCLNPLKIFKLFTAQEEPWFENSQIKFALRFEQRKCAEIPINQFIIIYSYFLILFVQTKITLSIFFNNWVNRRNKILSASRAVFSCMDVWWWVLYKIYLYLYNLYCTNTTYCGTSLWLNLSSWWQ